jgi:hypothetical protein
MANHFKKKNKNNNNNNNLMTGYGKRNEAHGKRKKKKIG